MWCFSNDIVEYIFKTREEAIQFIREATIKNIEQNPDDPDQWSMIPGHRDTEDCLFEIEVVSTEEALQDWSKKLKEEP